MITPLNSYRVVCDSSGNAPYPYIYLKFKATEPLLFLSPFISSHTENHAGFIGIQSMTVTANIGTATRAMSNASYALNSQNVSVRTISSVDYE